MTAPVRFQPAVVPTNLELPQLPAKADAELKRYLETLTASMRAQHARLAEALQLLNQARLYVGPLADRPAASGSRVVYVASDTATVWVDTGSWVQLVAAGGGGAAPDGYAEVSLLDLVGAPMDATYVLVRAS